MTTSFLRFLDHTQRRTTVGKDHTDEWAARRRDLYLTKKKHSQQTHIRAPEKFESPIPTSKVPQAHVLNSTATGIGTFFYIYMNLFQYIGYYSVTMLLFKSPSDAIMDIMFI
jgi:hypothetical protein